MRETVLLYNFTDKARLLKIRQALMPLGFRIKLVDKADYGKKLGVLAGVKGMEEDGAEDISGTGNVPAGDFGDELAVMAGFTSAQVDAFIQALRKKGVGRIDYKAVLTQTNREWDSVKLYEEIKREHEAMSGTGDGR